MNCERCGRRAECRREGRLVCWSVCFERGGDPALGGFVHAAPKAGMQCPRENAGITYAHNTREKASNSPQDRF